MAATANPLERLVVDNTALDLELLASTLEPVMRLDVKQGGFAWLKGVRDRLSSRKQVVAVLLSQLALHALDARHPLALRPQEIESVTGVKGNTLRPILKLLVDRGVVRQNETKAYFVPGFALEDAARFLSGVED